MVRSIAGAAVCLLLGRSASSAQGLVGMGPWDASAEFGFDSDRQRITDYERDAQFERTRFEERLGFRSLATLFDPQFVTSNVGFSAGLFQDRFTFAGKKTPLGGRLLSYDVGFTILPQKPYTTTLVANRTRGIVAREFAGRSDVLTENRGITFSWRQRVLPTIFSYRNELIEEEFAFGSQFARRSEARNLFTVDGTRHTETQNVVVHYSGIDLADLVRSELNNSTRDAGLMHRLNRGSILLTSSVRYFDRTGKFSSSSLGFDESLVKRFGKALSTGYSYGFLSNTSSGGRTVSHIGGLSITHQLYESLLSDASLRVFTTSFPGGREERYSVRGGPNYRKRIARGGLLTTSIAGQAELQKGLFGGQELFIVREPHAVQIGVPIRLNRPRVVPGTILVTDESGGFVFQEGVDYTIRAFGEFLEIDVLPLGRIRQVITVDYRASTTPVREFVTRTFSLRMGVDYSWIAPYFAFERATHDLLSGVDDSIFDEPDTMTVGVLLRREGPRLRGSITGEYRTYDSQRLTYDSTQFGQALSYQASPAFVVGFNATEDFSDFRTPLRKTSSGIGRATIGWTPPYPGLYAEWYSTVRLWRDTVAPGETFNETGLRVTWTIGRMALNSFVGYDMRERDGSRARGTRASILVVRRTGGSRAPA